jgi:serine/threonine protein kinase
MLIPNKKLREMNRRQQVKRRVGKYEVGRTIGEGTFAKVKFARNSETGEPVALKILDKEKVLKHKMAEQIRREIATMKLIKHPNVVQLYEVMASKTKIFIILEYVTGGELFDKIVNDGRMKEDEARRYFQQLIHAVDYCHSRGVYHRDLKPENLLLDSYGNLKISDFGLSALSQQVRVMTICFHKYFTVPRSGFIFPKNLRILLSKIIYIYLFLNMVYMLGDIRMMDSCIHRVEHQTTLLLRSA